MSNSKQVRTFVLKYALFEVLSLIFLTKKRLRTNIWRCFLCIAITQSIDSQILTHNRIKRGQALI